METPARAKITRFPAAWAWRISAGKSTCRIFIVSYMVPSPVAGCPTHSWFSNEWESDHRVDWRRLKPAHDSISPAYPGLRSAASWANPISTPSGFEHSQFQSGANRARAAVAQRAALGLIKFFRFQRDALLAGGLPLPALAHPGFPALARDRVPHSFAGFECVGSRVGQATWTPTHSKSRNEWGTRPGSV